MSKSTRDEWLASRPECVRKLAKEFPPGEELVMDDGRVMFLVGYTEDDELVVSPIDPARQYEFALAKQEIVCAAHFRREGRG